MNVGLVCYASVGGSGIVATELAKALARRNHQVHLISTEPPFRLGEYEAGLAFHRVHTPAYPVFREPQYLLSLTNKIVQLSREFSLDIVHAHYGIPHATAAYLAKQILASTHGETWLAGSQDHHDRSTGTDITLLGSDPSYSETVAFSIDQSDGVTAVSESLRRDTLSGAAHLARDSRDSRTSSNATSTGGGRSRSCARASARRRSTTSSSFTCRTSGRSSASTRSSTSSSACARAGCVAKLILVGEGPELSRAMRTVHEKDLACDVEALGEQDQVVPLLSVSDLFLLPSAQESFGLAALEAMACEVPVVASRVGGIPEVVEDGASGYLCEPADVDGMSRAAVALLTDTALHARFSKAGLDRVRRYFCSARVVPQYEAYYQEIIES
jgi:glycosyltransferase involved in cell wall biosynthesis